MKKQDAAIFFGLVSVALILFWPALHYLPSDVDDLIMLSAVAQRASPIDFFWNDWGIRNSAFRPLHSTLIWLFYHAWGVDGFPNQFLNWLLHCAVSIAMYFLLKRSSGSRLLASFGALLTLVSIATYSAAHWVSDRPTLFVALCTLALIFHLLHCERENLPVSIALVTALLITSLLSKESGLALVLLTLITAFAFRTRLPGWQGLALASTAVACIYMLFRFTVFHPGTATYAEEGFLFGTRYFESTAQLSVPWRLWSYAENIVKNIVFVFAPMFRGKGELALISHSFLWIPTLALAVTAWRGPLQSLQKYGLLLIVTNAVVHFALFRYRVEYLGQLGFVMFALGGIPSTRRRLWFISATCVWILGVSAMAVRANVQVGTQTRLCTLREVMAGREVFFYPIAPEVLNTLKRDYHDRVSSSATASCDSED